MLPWNVEDLTFDETRFKGIARLFPLPDLVMFPHVMQPINVFEPRYRALLNEALDSDGLIAMGVPAPGWQHSLDDHPQLLPYACLSKVVTHQRQEDGRYNVLLLGMRRIKIEKELSSKKLFREAKVSLLEDFIYTDNDSYRQEVQQTLTQQFQECLPNDQSINPVMSELLAEEVPLGVLTDLISFALPVEYKLKVKLLSENDVDQRAALLLDTLQHEPKPRVDELGKPRHRDILPPFSDN